MSWETVRLEEVCKIVGGTTPSTSKAEFWNGDIIWLSPVDLPEVGSISIVNDSLRKITSEAVKSSSLEILPIKSIVFSTRASIGKIGIVEKPLCTNQGFTNLIPSEKIYYKYLAYALKHNIQNISRLGNSTTFNEVSRTAFKNFQIPLPPLATQTRIAEILDAADALRRKDQELLKKYDELAQAIFIDMFGDPVKNEKGWEKMKMEKLMTIVRGGSPRPIDKFIGGTNPWIKIGDGTKGDDVYLTSTKEHITDEGLSKTRKLPAGSLIFANCGVSLGFARIITFEGCIHDGWLAFSDFDTARVNKIFLLKALNSITEYFRNSAPEGTQPNLNTGIMKDFELILPPIELQEKFERILTAFKTAKKSTALNNDNSRVLFNSLIQKAFKGDLV